MTGAGGTTRYGLIGTGHWADTVHAPALARRDDAAFVGVWGRHAGRTAAIAERHGLRSFDRPADLFAAVDVVCFAVPPDIQAPLAIEAARAGCHLLLEKPTALDPAAADALVAATVDVATVVFVTSRFVPAVARWVAEAQAAGGWHGGRATWFGSIFHPGNPFGASPWRRRAGALWDLGPHALSVLVPVLGPVTSVAAGRRGPGDTVHLVLRHGDGASSTVSLSLTVPPAATRTEAAVHGEEGWSAMPVGPTDTVDVLGLALDELLAAVEAGEPHPCDAAFGAGIVHVLAAAERAAPRPPVPSSATAPLGSESERT